MPRPSMREQLVREGLKVVHARGYATSGVQDITAAAGVPKGSFYNHFPSKEAFGVELLGRYFAELEAVLARTLGDRARPPAERLRRYVDALTDLSVAQDWAGCLLGNFAVETSAQSEVLRERLRTLFAAWAAPLAACVREAQAAGAVRAGLAPEALADFVLNAWEGAVLRMKVERSRRPLDQFRDVVFATVLA